MKTYAYLLLIALSLCVGVMACSAPETPRQRLYTAEASAAALQQAALSYLENPKADPAAREVIHHASAVITASLDGAAMALKNGDSMLAGAALDAANQSLTELSAYLAAHPIQE